MKQLLFVIALLLLSITSVSSQSSDCEFHENLSLETALIYPLPFGVIPEEQGGLGINKEAVIGAPFDFKWTMIWPDSFSTPTTVGIAYTDTLQFFLDRTIWILGEDTVSIPEGLSLVMTPESGVLLPNSDEPVACIKLEGTPSQNVTPGDYLMFFSIRSCQNIAALGFDGCQEAIIPSILTGFSGEYRLTIKPEGTTAVKETLNDRVSLEVSPNPFSSQTIIQFNSKGLSNDYIFEVFDANGRKVRSENMRLKSGVQRILFDGSSLNDGLYIFQFRGEEGIITDKLILQK